MKLNNNGNVQFDYRSEVNNVSVALQQWLATHEDVKEADDVRELVNKLETLYMSW